MINDQSRILAEITLQLQALTSEVTKLRDVVSGAPTHIEGWSSSTKAAAALQGEGVKNQRHLKRSRLDGAFTEGREIRNVSKGDRPTWEYHIPSCRKALQRYFRKLIG